jgi:hypothetical protein
MSNELFWIVNNKIIKYEKNDDIFYIRNIVNYKKIKIDKIIKKMSWGINKYKEE